MSSRDEVRQPSVEEHISDWNPLIRDFLQKIESSERRYQGCHQREQLMELQVIQAHTALHNLGTANQRDRITLNEARKEHNLISKALGQSEVALHEAREERAPAI